MTKRSRVDLSCPVVYENGAVKRVMFDGGYATFADAGKGASVQPCKFGGKEPDAMYGLNIYDFHARTRTPDLARFTRPDPLAEKTPHLSPCLLCANDPVNNTDPTGMEVWFNDFMYTPGCESFGDAKIYLNQAFDKNGFISAVAHESMHVGRFINGQGGQLIFNEVEAYAFEAAISINANELSDNLMFSSGAMVGENNIFGRLYHDAISSLSTRYSYYKNILGIISFKEGAAANNSRIYDYYPDYLKSQPLQTSLLTKYSHG